MSLFSYKSEKSKSNVKRNLLSVFNNNNEKDYTIHQEMTSQEISDIFSNRIIEVVKEQFELVDKPQM